MKNLILITVFIMFAIAGITSITSTSYISNQKIDEIILKKSQAKAEVIAKNVEYVLQKSSQPLVDLQELVLSLSERSDIIYAIFIDRKIQAVAHSDINKLNKIYKDSYTMEGAGKGEQKFSKWYADVQKMWVYDIMVPVYDKNGELLGAFDIGIPISEVDDAVADIVLTQLIAITAIFLICACVLMWLLGRFFKPLAGLQQALEDISKGDGDLTVRLPVQGTDEIAHISKAFNIFVGNINEIISKVVDTGLGIGRSATELRSQSQLGLSRGQAQSERTLLVATSINEMIATINEISQNAAGAANSANGANSETQSGRKTLQDSSNTINNLGDEMNNMSSVITSLAGKTQSIGSILDVIRGVSEQTNLLALNAAIEAARAGEAGRGFAVVADEVRNLATKTAQSTDEIQSMINQLQHEAKNAVEAMESSRSLTEEGTRTTAQALEVIENISVQVITILDMNTQVATATEEQSCVANEININMDLVNNSVQEGLIASQELEASSKTLEQLAQTLDLHVGSFKI
ncbi:MAG: methyl-accepting chemotaxis protein [Moritella sp.]|uniref:methyl-accepting chemotaxis protein n=1 Tax=Moritella sp. PE36 TaxID=58051 RepID=UPI00030A6157|nr:methyl-accepting chemotaxis protein [Moritella sp. PE36]PHR89671.1 MAG: methyl-accepting chemotaxis protein [Moritella sp.]